MLAQVPANVAVQRITSADFTAFQARHIICCIGIVNHLVAHGATQFHRNGDGFVAAGVDYIVVDTEVVAVRIIGRVSK